MATESNKSQSWLSPIEAIKLIGKLCCDRDWNDTEARTLEDDKHKDALRQLYASLQSGEVEAYYHQFDGLNRKLSAIDAADEFFHIDLKINSCRIGPVEGRPFSLKIHKEQLENFLRKHMVEREPSSNKARNDALQCLRHHFSNKTESELGINDKERYATLKSKLPSLSKRSYGLVKQQAAEQTNRRSELKTG